MTASNDSPIDRTGDRTHQSTREYESFGTPGADRPPTEEEERAAEAAAADVDLERVAEQYEAAMETGARVRGEGEIERARDHAPRDPA